MVFSRVDLVTWSFMSSRQQKMTIVKIKIRNSKSTKKKKKIQKNTKTKAAFSIRGSQKASSRKGPIEGHQAFAWAALNWLPVQQKPSLSGRSCDFHHHLFSSGLNLHLSFLFPLFDSPFSCFFPFLLLFPLLHVLFGQFPFPCSFLIHFHKSGQGEK